MRGLLARVRAAPGLLLRRLTSLELLVRTAARVHESYTGSQIIHTPAPMTHIILHTCSKESLWCFRKRNKKPPLEECFVFNGETSENLAESLK